jgi:probable F420-dependent oxidoreductase
MLKVDLTIGDRLEAAAQTAKDAEATGYHGIWSMEAAHDPFLPLLLAAEHTERLELGTAIAVALARNPMLLANLGYDLHAYSAGRLILGLGSQIKPHIERRFSMPWSHPAARMREFIMATRAIWDSWNNGTRLDFNGTFYTHTLMTPMFNPGPNPFGQPRIFLAAVGNDMTEVAGEVADGLVIHPFSTTSYIRQVTMPALERGLAKSGRERPTLELSIPVLLATGRDEQEIDTARLEVRKQIAFYGSTPAYRPVLDLHGWGDLHTELNMLSKRGDWQTMTNLIDDDMFDQFAIAGEPRSAGQALHERFGDLVDRVTFYLPHRPSPEDLGVVVEEVARLAAAPEPAPAH